MAAASRRAGRNPDDIELMAVTKTVSAERIREAYAAGARLFGENRVQEFEAKSQELRELAGTHFNMDRLPNGMSQDLEVAGEEGATPVRVGTAIFGERPPLP